MSLDFERVNLGQEQNNKLMKSSSIMMKSSHKNLNLFNFSEKFDVPQNEQMLENLLSNQDQMFDHLACPEPPWILQTQQNRDEMLFEINETGFQQVQQQLNKMPTTRTEMDQEALRKTVADGSNSSGNIFKQTPQMPDQIRISPDIQE